MQKLIGIDSAVTALLNWAYVKKRIWMWNWITFAQHLRNL